MAPARKSNHQINSKTAALAVCLAFLVIIAGCAGPAGIEDENNNDQQTTHVVETDERPSPTAATSNTPTEQPPTTSTPTPDPSNTPTATPELDPEDYHIRVINESPDAGLSNETLQNDTLQSLSDKVVDTIRS